MTRFLLDTNVLVEPQRRIPNRSVLRWLAEVAEADLYLSAFTFAELRKGIAKLGSTRRADVLETGLLRTRNRFSGRILAVDDDVLDRWGQITGAAAAVGRSLPEIDEIFAATALCHNMTLVTRNERHLIDSGVRLLNPWM